MHRLLKRNFILSVAGGILAIGIFTWDLSLERGVAGGVPYICVVLLGLWAKDRRYIIISACICSGLTMIGFYFSPSGGGEVWKTLMNRSLAIFNICILAICLLYKQREKFLKDSNMELELRVAERTAELSAINQKLESQIEAHQWDKRLLNKSESDLRDLVNKLEHTNQDLESFAAIVSHDLKAPIRKIITFWGRIQANGSDLAPKSQNYLSKAIHTGKTMLLLIDDILKYSQVGGKAVELSPTNLTDVVLEAQTNLELQIKETNAKLNFDDLPVLRINKSLMLQLFQNLISNSLKYRNQNVPPEINIKANSFDDEFFNIMISDNGLGFDEKYKNIIFNPMERLDEVREVEGTGMGLAICKKVVLFHGGQISVSSEPEKGTTFFINLPKRLLL